MKITALATTGDKFVGPYLRALILYFLIPKHCWQTCFDNIKDVIRNNTLTEETVIDIQGSSSDFVIEFNAISGNAYHIIADKSSIIELIVFLDVGLLSNQTAITVASTTDHILVRWW